MATLSACLHETNPSPAIIISSKRPRTITHAQLAENVGTLRKDLSVRGIAAGTKIALVIAQPHVFTAVFLALTLHSTIVAPLNQGLKQAEFAKAFEELRPELIVLSQQEVEKQGAAFLAAREARLCIVACTDTGERSFFDFASSNARTGDNTSCADNEPKPTDVALVLQTSGTTGRPKAVPLTHHNLLTSMSNIAQHYSLTRCDLGVLIMPLFHIHGLVAGLLSPLFTGGAVVVSPDGGLVPSFFQDAMKNKATWYTATPTLHRLALELPNKYMPTFRFVRSCSSPLPSALLERLQNFYSCPIVEAYAMTEAAHQVCSNPVDFLQTRAGSVGFATNVQVSIIDDRGHEVATGDVGEIAIKGENVMGGYLNNEDANSRSFTAKGFFRTGDQGTLSEDGFLSLTGRIKELINKGGEKLSPVEIDDVLGMHPHIVEAVSFAVPDEMYGENVAVAIVLEHGMTMTASELKAWARTRLLHAKVPNKVFFVDRVPKTAVGKLQRTFVAKAMLCDGRPGTSD